MFANFRQMFANCSPNVAKCSPNVRQSSANVRQMSQKVRRMFAKCSPHVLQNLSISAPKTHKIQKTLLAAKRVAVRDGGLYSTSFCREFRRGAFWFSKFLQICKGQGSQGPMQGAHTQISLQIFHKIQSKVGLRPPGAQGPGPGPSVRVS